MSEVPEDWRASYRYGPGDDDVDCYYLFAPVRDSEVNLFQLDVMLAYNQVLRCFATVVMSDGEVHQFRTTPPALRPPTDGADIVRHADRFQLEVDGLLVLTSDAPDRFRIETTDAANGLHADLEVRPHAKHIWPTQGYDYFTTLGSVVEGTITVNDKAFPISARAAYEHATYEPADDPDNIVRLPPFWHYEYVSWSDGDTPFGSILWNVLDQAGDQINPAGFATSCPADRDTSYDLYEVTYGDVEEHEGNLIPRSWEVLATRGPESLRYRSRVRTVASSAPRDEGFFVSFVLECEGDYRGPDGDRRLLGVGRAEYINWTLNPVEVGTATK